jgi:hypothetical protein
MSERAIESFEITRTGETYENQRSFWVLKPGMPKKEARELQIQWRWIAPSSA